MDTSLGQAKGLIKFDDFDSIFKVIEGLRLLNLLRRRRHRRDNFLYARYILSQWMEFHQICMDISLRQA